MNSKDQKKKEQEIINIAAVEQEIKEEKQEEAQEAAQAIRAKNAETFFVRLRDTDEAKQAIQKEEEFYLVLRTRGVTLEDVQGLNANAVSLTTSLNKNHTSTIISSAGAYVRRERDKSEEPASTEQDATKDIKIDSTKLKISDNESLRTAFLVADIDKDKKLNETEFKELKEKTHILSVGETLKEGAKQLSEAVSPVEMEKGKAEISVGQ